MPRVTGRSDRLSSYKTEIRQCADGITAVKYHKTDIVCFDAATVILEHGGHKGVTTKRKMNQAARQFGLGYSVHQKNHEWFVTTKTGVYPYDDRKFHFDRATGVPHHLSFAELALAAARRNTA